MAKFLAIALTNEDDHWNFDNRFRFGLVELSDEYLRRILAHSRIMASAALAAHEEGAIVYSMEFYDIELVMVSSDKMLPAQEELCDTVDAEIANTPNWTITELDKAVVEGLKYECADYHSVVIDIDGEWMEWNYYLDGARYTARWWTTDEYRWLFKPLAEAGDIISGTIGVV